MKDLIRFYVENEGSIVATIGSIDNKGLITCYAHIGQHSVCHIDYFADLKEAKFNEYQDLLKELINIGYKPEVENMQLTEAWRNPTKSELHFGYGAIHYVNIKVSDFINCKTGNLKKWIKLDGMRYNR